MSEQQVERALGTGAKDSYDTPEEEAQARRMAGLPPLAEKAAAKPAPPATPAPPAAQAPVAPASVAPEGPKE